MLSRLSFFGIFAIMILSCLSCGSKGGGGGINFFSLQDDINLGLQVSEEINNSPDFKILNEANNKEVYQYMYKIRDKILNSGQVKYRQHFKWELKIVDDDKVLNAFATPGGYIYIYTGLILYLDSEDQLAGVVGHEIGHADLRHSTRQMSKVYGIQVVGDAVLGKESALNQIVGGLINLKFSRSHESESDAASVRYLCATDYNAAGAAGFFQKIQSEGGAPPQFMSTHPNPDNRVQNIMTDAQERGCPGNKTYKTEYARIKSILKNRK